jgi:large conductance mechanosensitive channel
MGMIQEFKEFAVKGNVIDLAVGVIIGAAFGKIVTSSVNDIIMPPIGKAMGGVNFADLYYSLDPAKTAAATSLAEAKATGAAIIAYGQFINNVIDFLIVAACVFLLVKAINSLKRPAPAAPPTTKDCPHCRMTIPAPATRCGHCTSQLA